MAFTLWLVADVAVRPIEDGELVDWVAAMHLAFHVNRSAEEEATQRREWRRQDLGRSLGAFDNDRAGELVGTYASFTTQLTLPGTRETVQTDAVTAVSVKPTHRRRGILRTMIARDLHAARERGEVASVLIAAEWPIYGRFGFGPATQQASYRLETAHTSFVRAAPAGRVELLTAQHMRQVAPEIFDRYRVHCPGQIDRDAVRWDLTFGMIPAPWRTKDELPHYAAYVPQGADAPTGYVTYRSRGGGHNHVPSSHVEVDELIALDGEAYLALWRYLAEIDLVSEVTAEARAVDEPLQWLLTNPRKAFQEVARTDFLWLRPLDTAAVLGTRRYATEDRLVFEVDDPLGIGGGRFALEGGPHGAICRDTTASAQLGLGMTALGALLLGGADAHGLALGGQIEEHAPGAVERLARMFIWPSAPWCSTFF